MVHAVARIQRIVSALSLTGRFGYLLALGVTASSVLLDAPTVHAQTSGRDVEKASQVLRLNREAMELYESLDFELARKQLLEALELGRKAGLDTHSVMAKTHGNLGLVYGAGLKDEAKAIEHFKKALAIRPDFRIAKEQASPEIEKLFERAQKEPSSAKPAEAAESPLNEPASPATQAALRCPTAGEVSAGDDITLKCVTAEAFKPASVVLFYKRAGEEEFVALPMRAPTPGAKKATWSAKIPGTEVNGSWLPFYFEARSGSGEALALSGRNDSPNIITIKAGGEAPASASPARASKRPRAVSGDDAEGDDEENPLVRQARVREGIIDRAWYMGLGVGSGAGYASGDGVEAYKNYVRGFSPGLAAAGLAHATPELGYYVTPTTALSVQGRIQYIPRDSSVTAGGAVAVLGRALFFTGEGRSRFYGSLCAGGGEGFRLQVEAKKTDGTIVKDTVKGGPLVAGAGGGFSYDFNPTFSWMIETNVLAGFPSFSAVVDVNTGVRANF